MVIATRLLFLLAILAWVIASPLPYSSTIGYQVHSWNDLRSWRAGFAKGVQWMKIDPNIQPPQICQLFDRVPKPVDSRGCFVLNHDTPAPPVNYRTSYNTTGDVLAMIADPQNADIFANPDRRISIALCFKTNLFSPCDDSPNDRNWQSLVSDFVSAAQALISSLQLNVEFVIDGAGVAADNTTSCLGVLWLPWNYTYIDSPALAYWLNDDVDAHYRFTVLNTELTPDTLAQWQMRALTNYGKFHDEPYPYLLWEPSDQQTIMQGCDVYLHHGQEHAPGLRFAINIDPVQLTVYAANASGLAWNIPTPESVSQNASRGHVVFADENSVVYLFRNVNGSTIAQTLNTSAPLSPDYSFSDALDITSQLTLTGGVAFVSEDSSAHLALLADNQAGSQLCKVNAQPLALSCQAKQNLPSLSTLFALSLVPSTQPSLVFGMGLSSLDASPRVLLYQLQSSGTAQVLAQSAVVSFPGAFGMMQSASIAAVETSPQSTVCDGAALTGLLTISTSNGTLLFAIVCADSTSVVVGPLQPLDVGSDSSVSLLIRNESILAAVVASNSFCWNCESKNKNPAVGLCDQVPLPSPLILSYAYGSIESFAAHIAAGTMLSACETDVLRGTFDWGSRPSAQLYLSSNNDVILLELHEGVPNPPAAAYSSCGPPLAADTLVVDAWAVPDLV